MPTAPDLAPPGAGLPPLEGWIARNIMFPVACKFMSWEHASDMFQREGWLILQMANAVPEEKMDLPVLIPRIRGIEDSSRNWSPAMVLEHLMIVGRQICEGIVSLSHGQKPIQKADIAAVKPKGGHGMEIVAEFRTFLSEYAQMLEERVGSQTSRTTFEHPWFGELTAFQWMVLAAMHQRIHRRQMERILHA